MHPSRPSKTQLIVLRGKLCMIHRFLGGYAPDELPRLGVHVSIFGPAAVERPVGLLVDEDESQLDQLRGADVYGELIVVLAAEECNGFLRDGCERVGSTRRSLAVFGAHFGVGFVVACDGAGGVAVETGAVGPGCEFGADMCNVGRCGLERWVEGVVVWWSVGKTWHDQGSEGDFGEEGEGEFEEIRG